MGGSYTTGRCWEARSKACHFVFSRPLHRDPADSIELPTQDSLHLFLAAYHSLPIINLLCKSQVNHGKPPCWLGNPVQSSKPSGAPLVWPEQEGGHRSQGERRWEAAIWPLSEAGAVCSPESNTSYTMVTLRVQMEVLLLFCSLLLNVYTVYVHIILNQYICIYLQLLEFTECT